LLFGVTSALGLNTFFTEKGINYQMLMLSSLI